MKRSANRSIDKLLGIEGGYSDHPSDSGGKTRYGITEEVARNHGYEGDMKDLPLPLARQIYIDDYWDANKLDRIAELNENIAFEIFETEVNTPKGTGVKILQSLLNVFNMQGEIYEDIEVDGIVGDETLGAYKAYFMHRRTPGMTVLLRAQNSRQGEYYYKLAEKYSKYEDFVYGWFRERVKI